MSLPNPFIPSENPFMAAAAADAADQERKRARRLRRVDRGRACLRAEAQPPRAQAAATVVFVASTLLAYDRADEALTEALVATHLSACSLRTSRLPLGLALRLYVGLIIDAAGVPQPALTLECLWAQFGPALDRFGDLETLSLLQACHRLNRAFECERADRVRSAASGFCRGLGPACPKGTTPLAALRRRADSPS